MNAAELDLSAAISEWFNRHDHLTEVELIRALGNVAHEKISNITKYMLRRERHGDDDTPADQAGD